MQTRHLRGPDPDPFARGGGRLHIGQLTTLLTGHTQVRVAIERAEAQAIRHAEIRRLALALHDQRRELRANRAQLSDIVDDLAPGLTDQPDRAGGVREMAKPTYEVEYEQMLLGRHVLRHSMSGRRKGGALERSAYILLSRIRIQGPMSIGELSEAFGLDASTLQRQTSAAMRVGLIERIPDPDGVMARKFHLTVKGTRLLDEEREASVKALDRVMADWPDEDIAAFAAYLKRFNTSIERLGGRPWSRP